MIIIKNNDEHWSALDIQLTVFKGFLECYKRTAEGVRYYVNCSPEEDEIEHKRLSEYILEVLQRIKRTDLSSYKTICTLYKDDIRDIVKTYRESKG